MPTYHVLGVVNTKVIKSWPLPSRLGYRRDSQNKEPQRGAKQKLRHKGARFSSACKQKAGSNVSNDLIEEVTFKLVSKLVSKVHSTSRRKVKEEHKQRHKGINNMKGGAIS